MFGGESDVGEEQPVLPKRSRDTQSSESSLPVAKKSKVTPSSGDSDVVVSSDDEVAPSSYRATSSSGNSVIEIDDSENAGRPKAGRGRKEPPQKSGSAKRRQGPSSINSSDQGGGASEIALGRVWPTASTTKIRKGDDRITLAGWKDELEELHTDRKALSPEVSHSE